MSLRIGDTGCRIPLLLHLIDILLLGSGWTTLAPLLTGLSPAISDLRAFGSPPCSWPRPQPPFSLHKRTLVVTREPCWSNDPHPPEQRPAVQRIAPRRKRATWTSIPWTKDLWTKVRAPRDSVIVARTAAQSHSELLNRTPHMCVYCLCHGRIPCRSAQHWCDSPPCLASTGPSPLTPAVWPQVCLQPRQRHAWLAASRSPARPQGLQPNPVTLRFNPHGDLVGMCPVLPRLFSPALLAVRFSSREPYPNVQCLACALCSVPLKWAPDSTGSRPVAYQGMPGSHSTPFQGSSPSLWTILEHLSSVMAPRPRTIFTEHLREASPAPSPSTGRRRVRPDREADVDLTIDEGGFLEEDLRVERAPDEFLAVAASLGRRYATGHPPTGPSGRDQRCGTGSRRPMSTRPTRRRTRSPRSPRRRSERTWPAGATRDLQIEQPWTVDTGRTSDGAVQISDDSEVELVHTEASETDGSARYRGLATQPPKPKPMPRKLREVAGASSSSSSAHGLTLVTAEEEADIARCDRGPPRVSWPALVGPGMESTEGPSPETPRFAKANLILRAALIDQSGDSALTGALGDTPPQAFVMSPELDSILRMCDYMAFACWVRLRVCLSPPLVHLFRASPLRIPVCPFTALVSPVAPLNTRRGATTARTRPAAGPRPTHHSGACNSSGSCPLCSATADSSTTPGFGVPVGATAECVPRGTLHPVIPTVLSPAECYTLAILP